MKAIKKCFYTGMIACIAVLTVFLLSIVLYHYRSLTSSDIHTPTNKTTTWDDQDQSSRIIHTNYTNLSPKAAYDKGVEFSKQINNIGINNLNKAVDYIQYSAATGYAEAQFKLGLMYFQGLGVQSNPAVGFYWIEKAAENNYPEAQIYLAYMYMKGVGAPVNAFKSNYWLRQARANGIDLSLDSLSFL